ncbi:MAG: hypothetical protein OHK0031_06170 [Anaerolineales bacterium]
MTRHAKPLFFLLIFSLLASACGLPTFFTAPTPTPAPLPPAIVESDPPAGSVLKPQQPVAFFFNQAMNHASVEAALKLENGGGIFTWIDDSTVTFTSAAPLAPDSAVTFTLASGALAANGLASLETQTFDFTVSGALRLTQTLPADGASEVSPAAAIVASFNQPVVALGGDPASQPAAFSLEPAASGRGEWLNTSTYIFYPEPALAGGASYRVQPNPALTSTSGGAFENPSAWTFATSLPRLLEISPGAEAPLAPRPRLSLIFNQPMDAASLENGALTVTCDSQPQTPSDWTWNERKSEASFTFARDLPRGANCVTQVSAALARSASGAALTEDVFQPFSIFPLLTLAEAPASPKRYSQPFQATLSAPLENGVRLTDFLTVSPPVKNLSAYAYDQQLSIDGDFAAETTYTFSLAAGLPDAYGQPSPAPIVFSGATLPPEAALNMPYVSLIFVRPQQPMAALQVASLSQIDVARAALSLSDYFALDNNFDQQQAFVFSSSGGEFWQETPPYLEQMADYTLPLATDGVLPPGIYLTRVSSNQIVSQYNRSQRRFFVLSSNINVTFKLDAKNALVWAVDLRTGQPVSAAEVKIFDAAGTRVASGVTGADGLWRGELGRAVQQPAYAVIAQPGDDNFGLASSQFNPGLSPWGMGVSTDTSGPQPFVYLYSDRPVYRPGDTIYFHGMARQRFNGRYANLPGGAAGWTIQLSDTMGNVLQTQPLQLSAYGAFDGAFTIPAAMTPGGAYLQVNGDQNPAGYRDTYSIYFQVADYRKPELNLAVTFDPAEAASGQPVKARLQADYFFGAPAPDVAISWRLYRQTGYFDLPGFQTGAYSADWTGRPEGIYGADVDSGMARTDANGAVELNFDGLTAAEISTYALEISASESGGFPVSARGTLTMHPDQFYAGIRPAQFVGRAGQALNFSLAAADWQKRLQPNQPLTLTWEKVTWKSQADRYGFYSYQPQATPLETKNVVTDGQGLASAAFTPAEAGTYRLRAAAGKNISETLLWVGGAGQAGWPVLPFDRIQLTAGQKSYQPGETASVFIPNPFEQPARALLTTERGVVMDARLLEIAPGGESVDIALTDDNAPNTFVAVTLLGADAQFRQGVLDLKVAPSSLTLNVTIDAPEKARPGQALTLDLRVTDAAGQPAQGEFSLAVVDLAALALGDPTAPDILPAFYDPQPLGVMTALTDAMDARRLLPQGGGMGGGGGDGGLTVRQKFPDTALWTTFVTAPDGTARVTLTLPDSLTTWQVDTRGIDQQNRVGQARLNVVTSKELLLRPLTPRFFVAGDHVRVGTAVNNTTDKDFNAEVTLTASGFSLDEKQAATQKVSVPAGGRALLWWWGSARAEESARLLFSAKAGAWSDATLPADGEVPILRYSVPQTFSTAGVLSAAGVRREIVSLPRRFEPQGGDLRLELTPSLGAYLLQAAGALSAPDEFSSDEEIASYLLAVFAASDSGAAFSLPPQVAENVQRLIRHQNGDGGWEWYWSNRYDAASDPRLTAQVLLALDEARRHDALPTPSGSGGWDFVFDNARNFLQNGILARQPVEQMRPAEMDELSFLLYADLAAMPAGLEGGWASPYLLALTGRNELLSPASQAMNYLSLLKLGTEQPGLLGNLEQTANRSASGAFWQADRNGAALPATPAYQTAVALTALAEHQPLSPLMQDALRFLVFSRAPKGGWASGMETAWAMRALSAMMRLSGDTASQYNFGATLNGSPLISGQGQTPQTNLSALDALYQRSPNDLLIQRGEGAGQLFYRADLSVLRPAADAPMLNAGLAVSRDYFDCSSGSCQPISAWQLTTLPGRVTVRVTVSLPSAMYYVNVEDYAPAGAEIANPALKTTQQGEASLETEFFTPENPFERGWGWWAFNAPQIYRDHLRWSAPYLEAGTYVLTYTLVPSLAGEFQVLPARAWQTFFPEVQGTSAGSIFKILPQP